MASDQLSNDPAATAGNHVTSRRTVLAAVLGAAFTAACGKVEQPKPTSDTTTSVPVESVKPKTPYEKYQEAIPADLKQRMDAMKAKSFAERQGSPWDERLLYALGLALQKDYTGEYNSTFEDTKVGTDGESLQDHTPVETTLNLNSSGRDIWLQTCYFEALLASMLTRDTQTDFIPLVAGEGTKAEAYWQKVVQNNEPGNWHAGDAESSWSVTSKGEPYSVTENGKTYMQCGIDFISANTGKKLTDTMRFIEMPLLEAVTSAGDNTSTTKHGIWIQVND